VAGRRAVSARDSDRSWSLWRQDDNGTSFEIRRDHTRDEAERLRDELEARGHKQLYWVASTGSSGSSTDGS
jgi:hypothetical protein